MRQVAVDRLKGLLGTQHAGCVAVRVLDIRVDAVRAQLFELCDAACRQRDIHAPVVPAVFISGGDAMPDQVYIRIHISSVYALRVICAMLLQRVIASLPA